MDHRSLPDSGSDVPTGAGALRRPLIDATLRSLAEVGVRGTTLEGVATKAGLPLREASVHFADRDALLQAAFEALTAAAASEPDFASGEFETRNPATGELLARLPVAGAAEIDAAVERARAGCQPRDAARAPARCR